MKFTYVFLWAAVTMVYGYMKLISIDNLFLGFSIMMAANYLGWEKK